MKNIIKGIFLIILSLIIVSIVFVVSATVISKNVTYPNWVLEYLKGKYYETMIIKDVYSSDVGYNAIVSIEDKDGISFRVIGKYTDRYLERVLEYDAEQECEKLFKGSSCTASMFPMSSVKNPYPELYSLYLELNRPPDWHEVPKYVRLNEIFLTIDLNIYEDDINCVIEKLNSCNFSAHKVYVECKNLSFVLNYNEDECQYCLLE